MKYSRKTLQPYFWNTKTHMGVSFLLFFFISCCLLSPIINMSTRYLKISLGISEEWKQTNSSFHVFYVWKKTRQKNPINDVHPKLNPNTLFLDKYKYGLLLMWFFRNDRWFQIKTAKKTEMYLTLLWSIFDNWGQFCYKVQIASN